MTEITVAHSDVRVFHTQRSAGHGSAEEIGIPRVVVGNCVKIRGYRNGMRINGHAEHAVRSDRRLHH